MASQPASQIFNQTRDQLLADRVEVARSFWARGRGLMGRATLPLGFALVIFPESSIHTFFMRVPIDVLFVGRDERSNVAFAAGAPTASAAQTAISIFAAFIGGLPSLVADDRVTRSPSPMCS